MERQKTSLGKKVLKYGTMVVVAFVIFFIGASIGSSGAKITLNDKKVDAVALDKEIAKLKSEKKDAKAELSDQKSKNKEVFAMIDRKDEIASSVDKAQKELDDKKAEVDKAKSELNSVKSRVDDKKDELSTVTASVIKAKSAPKVLSAGTYTVGKDLPAGRYKATPIGEGSNFVTYDPDGTPDVNTILGVDGEASYTFEIDDDYKIQTEAQVKLTPIQ